MDEIRKFRLLLPGIVSVFFFLLWVVLFQHELGFRISDVIATDKVAEAVATVLTAALAGTLAIVALGFLVTSVTFAFLHLNPNWQFKVPNGFAELHSNAAGTDSRK